MASVKDILTNKQPAADALPLQDIHLAEHAGYWPLAPGWWILILCIPLAIWMIVRFRQRVSIKKRQVQIAAMIAPLEQKLITEPSNEVIAELNTLLRQIAVNYYPRSDLASLTGDKWLTFLDTTGETNGFSQGAGKILGSAPYQTGGLSDFNQIELCRLVVDWANKIIQKGGHQK